MPETTYNGTGKENDGPSPSKRVKVNTPRCVTVSTQTEIKPDHVPKTICVSTGTQTEMSVEMKQCQAPQDLHDVGKACLREHSYWRSHAQADSSGIDTDLLNEQTVQMTSTPRPDLNNHKHTLITPTQLGSPIKCCIDKILEEEIDADTSSSDISMDDNEAEDPTYQSMSHSDSQSSESSDSIDEISDTKYIVYGSQLQELFTAVVCQQCKSATMTTNAMTKGSELVINFQCLNGHDIVWRSQPEVDRMSMGNLQIAAAVLFGGCTFSSIRTFASLLNLKFIQKSTFNSLQTEYLFPVVHETWENHQSAVLAQHKDVPVSLAGDGRCDSPGFSAKYGTYTAMTMDTGLILDFSVVQVTEAGNSVGMEKLGLQHVLKKLEEEDINIDVMTTDRHTQIRKYLRTEKPDINHQFDVWHLAKSVGKRISQKAKLKSCNALGEWRKCIVNHLWWSAGTCDGDAEVLIEKWTSILHHTVNQHIFPGNHVESCGHGEMDDVTTKKTKWMTTGSPAHEALKGVVLDKTVLKDVRQLSHFCHTGRLESYHSVLLKYCPKRLHFSMNGMIARTELAALDNNFNTGRQQAKILKGKRKGELRYKTEFPKMNKQWVAKPIYEAKSYAYAHKMVDRVVSGKRNKDIVPMTRRTLPKNISSVECPAKDELIRGHSSRFRR